MKKALVVNYWMNINQLNISRNGNVHSDMNIKQSLNPLEANGKEVYTRALIAIQIKEENYSARDKFDLHLSI